MILGQAEEQGTDWLGVAVSAISWPAKIAIDAITKARSSGGDVDAAAEAEVPQIPEAPDDVTGVVGAGKASARKPQASYGGVEPGYPEDAPAAASVWPWVIGLALVGGGAYWLVKRKKKGNKR